MAKKEVEYLKRLNKILERENKILQDRLALSESVVETLFSHTKEKEE
jgi:hypothetical protein